MTVTADTLAGAAEDATAGAPTLEEPAVWRFSGLAPGLWDAGLAVVDRLGFGADEAALEAALDTALDAAPDAAELAADVAFEAGGTMDGLA